MRTSLARTKKAAPVASTAGSPFGALFASAGLPVANRLPNDGFILCDVSGSMGHVTVGGVTRITALRDAVKLLQGGQVLPFNHRVFDVCPHDRIPDPDGFTEYHRPINAALDLGASVMMLIADGVTAWVEETMEAAQRAKDAGVKVNTLFVGDPADSGAKAVLRRVAEITGGTYDEHCMGNAPKLAAAIEHAMLPQNAGTGIAL